jgi:hypothetical protein
MVEMLVPRPADRRLRERAGGYVRNEIVDAKREFMTADQYHSKHAAGTVSRSELQTFAENPNVYRSEVMLRTTVRVISDPMRFGQCLHMELLAGHEKPPRVPDCSRSDSPLAASNRRQGNAWKKWLADNGPYYLLPDECEKLDAMVEKVRHNDAVKEFLEEGGAHNTKHESTILAKHEPTGIRTRCRYDIESVWLFDIKKCRDASPEAFASHCVDFGYHCQGAFYQDHNAAFHNEQDYRPFILIAIQDGGDHRCEVYEMSPEFVQIGRTLNAARLDLFAMYQAAWEKMEAIAVERGHRANPEDLWTPASEGKIQYLNPPNKAMYQMEWEPDPLEVHKVLTARVEKSMRSGKIERGLGEAV